MSIRDLITLNAFHAHPKNAKLPLHARIPGEPVLVLGVGAQQVRAAIITVPKTANEIVIPEHIQMFQKRGPLGDMLLPLRKHSEYGKAKHVLIVLQHSWKVYVRTGYFEGADVNSRLRLDAAATIDETEGDSDRVPYASDSVYAAITHPNADRILLFSAPRSEIDYLHDAVQEAGLKVVGCKIAPLSAIEYFYARARASEDGDDVADILYIDRQSYCLIERQRLTPEGAPVWADVRFASRRSEEITESVTHAIRERTKAGRPIILIPGDNKAEEVRRLFPALTIISPFENDPFDVFTACAR